MGAGFNVFKRLFGGAPNWRETLQARLDAYHGGGTLLPFMNIARVNDLMGGVATVPVYNGPHLNNGQAPQAQY